MKVSDLLRLTLLVALVQNSRHLHFHYYVRPTVCKNFLSESTLPSFGRVSVSIARVIEKLMIREKNRGFWRKQYDYHLQQDVSSRHKSSGQRCFMICWVVCSAGTPHWNIFKRLGSWVARFSDQGERGDYCPSLSLLLKSLFGRQEWVLDDFHSKAMGKCSWLFNCWNQLQIYEGYYYRSGGPQNPWHHCFLFLNHLKIMDMIVRITTFQFKCD